MTRGAPVRGEGGRQPPRTEGWVEANQRHLAGVLAAVKRHLVGDQEVDDDEVSTAPPALGAPPALAVLVDAFGLSRFERDVLVLSAGVDLDGSFAALCAEVNGDPARPFPTFSMALSTLPDAHWSALSPGAPLRRWQLVELGPGTVTTGALRIDERVLHYLAGVNQLDERVSSYVEPVTVDGRLPPSQQMAATAAAGVWSQDSSPLPVVQLCGPDRTAKLAVAAAACSTLGLTLHRLRAGAVPAAADVDWFCRLWDREATLVGSALLLTCEPEPGAGLDLVVQLVERLRVPVLISSREPLAGLERTSVRLDVDRPTPGEQRARWRDVLGTNGDAEDFDRIVMQFDFGYGAIDSAAAFASVESRLPVNGERHPSILWDACRAQARPRLDDLAQRIGPLPRPSHSCCPRRSGASSAS